MTDISLFDEKNSTYAEVSAVGEQYVAPRFYSDPYYVSVAETITPYQVVPARSGKKFIVTSILLATDKAYGSSTVAETLTIYEASPSDFDTNLKTFTQVDFLRNDRLIATGLNLSTSCAVSLVAIADSNNVDVTIAGYYVPC